MADDPKPANLANNSIILATLIAAGSLFFRQEAPLEGARPPEPPIHQTTQADQDVDATPWQDPFAAVDRFRKKQDSPSSTPEKNQCGEGVRHCKSPLAALDEKKRGDVDFIVVTMSGAPYFDNAESRRRTRYAVLAGLRTCGFAPVDSQHIGYFSPDEIDVSFRPNSKKPPLPDVVPYEGFEQKQIDNNCGLLANG